jgi:hypothetical protein
MAARDETGWLGREDSNLRMAESKSTSFTLFLNCGSENLPKFDGLLLNRLAASSECNAWMSRLFAPHPSPRQRSSAEMRGLAFSAA